MKKLKKIESKFVMTPSSNPVNALSIRKSKFGMVGYTTITIDSLRTKNFKLDKVPGRSPLNGSLLMNLTVHSESSMQEKGFLTYFTEVNGYGDWNRRWCVLRGEPKLVFHNFPRILIILFGFADNTMYFWKYPEDEQKRKAPIENETIALHDCISDTVALAPRDVTSRMNTFMLENRRRIQSGDREALNIAVV